MAQSPDYSNYTRNVAESAHGAMLKEGEYEAIIKKNKKKARKYFTAAGVNPKTRNEARAFKQTYAAGRRDVALQKRSKRNRKRGSKR